MKKGIVMEHHRKHTIVMTHDGLIEKAYPINDADIGFEVDYEPLVQKQWSLIIKEKFLTIRVAALACIILIALLPFYMVANGNETYAYVDIDINPSIELEVNEDLEVSNSTPLNDDAKVLLDEIGVLEGKNIEDAIEIIIGTSEEKGLINAAKNVLIGVHYLKDEEKDPIIKTIEDHFTKKPSDWEVVTVAIPEEVRATAEKNKESMNIALANTVANQTDEQTKSIVTKEDKEVLQSFFNTDKTEVKITNEESSEKGKPAIATEKENDHNKVRSFKDKTHPSELKGKNGEINSSKNESHNNGKAKGHKKDKFNKGDHRHNGKANHGNGKKNNVEKSKHKDHHKEKDKKDNEHKGNNGNGNHGKKYNGNGHRNGHGHENKGKNGNNGNGKNKNDGFSFAIPLYK